MPAIEDLEIMAQKLYRAYTSSRAQFRAIYDTEGRSEWSKIIPLGTTWTGTSAEESSADVGIMAKKPRASKAARSPPTQASSTAVGIATVQSKQQGTAKNAEEIPPDVFKGDRVLARSIGLIRDLMWSRECAYAVAEGDVGRLYEILKVKYTGLASKLKTEVAIGRLCYSHLRGLPIPNIRRICSNF